MLTYIIVAVVAGIVGGMIALLVGTRHVYRAVIRRLAETMRTRADAERPRFRSVAYSVDNPDRIFTGTAEMLDDAVQRPTRPMGPIP